MRCNRSLDMPASSGLPAGTCPAATGNARIEPNNTLQITVFALIPVSPSRTSYARGGSRLAAGATSRALSRVLQLDAELRAFLIQVTTLQAQCARRLGHAVVVQFQ